MFRNAKVARFTRIRCTFEANLLSPVQDDIIDQPNVAETDG